MIREEYLPIGTVLRNGTIIYSTLNEDERAIVRDKIMESTERHCIPITAIASVEVRCMVDGEVPKCEAFDGFLDRMRSHCHVEILDYHVRYCQSWDHLNEDDAFLL